VNLFDDNDGGRARPGGFHPVLPGTENLRGRSQIRTTWWPQRSRLIWRPVTWREITGKFDAIETRFRSLLRTPLAVYRSAG
jgi:hypothetical protein